MIMTPQLFKCHLGLLCREGKRVNYHDNEEAERGADSGHGIPDDQDDSRIINAEEGFDWFFLDAGR